MTADTQKHIVAMGGGGFSIEPENPLLDRYILGLAPGNCPRVCFLPTASGDAADYIDRFYAAFARFPCTRSHLSLFRLPTAELRSFVFDQDVIYVGGGNTRSLLALWREWQLDLILADAWAHGVILAGLSAGAICWFEEGVTDSVPGELTVVRGLGLLRGGYCPHYDGEPERRPAYHRLVRERLIGDGYAADDGVAFHFVGDQLHTIVSSRPQAKAYRLEHTSAGLMETPIEPVYLGE